MANKKINFNDQQEHELCARLVDIDRELFALRNELAMNKKLDKPHLIKAKRKEKAQILTVMTQKQIAKGVL
jgi:large subunit ribosomal protein L29